MENQKTILYKIFEKSLYIYIITSLGSFILDKVWEAIWLQYIPIVVLVLYIIGVLVSIYNSKVDSLFNLKKIELLCYQILLPILLTIMIGIVCVDVTKTLENSFIESTINWFLSIENRALLLILFWGFVLLFSFIAYERVEICKATKTECEFSGKTEMLYTSSAKKLEKISQELENVQNTLERKNEVGYTATCIPIRYNKEHETYVFALVQNLSHEKSQWMFPGSHVEVSNNQLEEKFDLTDISIIPEMVISEKVKKEAGLLDIQFIDPYYEKVSWDHSKDRKEERNYPNTCYPAKAPVFNYLFRVSESAKCYKEHNHRCHYDFTYIGEYSEINESEAEYEVVEVEFNKNKNFRTMEYTDAIAYITSKLGNQINKKIKGNKKNRKNSLNTPFDQLCLDSIPEMIYNAILFYIDYQES